MTIRVLIPRKTDAFIRYWVNKCPYEIAGMAPAYYDKPNNLIVIGDVELLEQTVTSASVDMEADAMNKLSFDKREEGPLRFHFHSHADMGVFFSKTDTDGYEDRVKNGGWLLAGVYNKKGESKFTYYQGVGDRELEPNPCLVITEGIEVMHDSLLSQEDITWADTQFDTKIHVEKTEYKGTYSDYMKADNALISVDDIAKNRIDTSFPCPNLGNWGKDESFTEIAQAIEAMYGINRKNFSSVWQMFIQDYKEKPKNYQSVEDYIEMLSTPIHKAKAHEEYIIHGH